MTASGHDLVVLDSTRTWQRHPWQQVHDRAENVAERVAGHRAVGIVGEPTVEFVAAIPGAMMAGAAVSILPGPVRGADPEVWAQSTLARFAAVGVGTVLSQGSQLDALRGVQHTLAVEDLAKVAHPRRSAAFSAPTGAATAVLQGTAGSTGTPRTACLPGAAVLANLRGLISRTAVDTADVGCSWLPLYHDMGLNFLLAGMLLGADLWQAPTSAFAASPFSWLQWLSQSRASLIAAPNMAYSLIGKYSRRISDVDLSHLRFALNGGEPVDCAGTQRFISEMARFGLRPGALAASYGLAESSCAVTVPMPDVGLLTDEVEVAGADGSTRRRLAVLGAAVDGMQVRITPFEHRFDDIRGRAVGQVEIRGTSMMSGYLDGDPLDRQSWFSTGDLGYFVDGGLVVCGRAKEVISVAGRNVFPTEIERVAAQVKGVREGAVVAVGINERAARPGLVITAEFRGPDEPGARSELVARVASECGVVPSAVVFVAPGTLPRTSSGKLRRLEVKRGLEAASV